MSDALLLSTSTSPSSLLLCSIEESINFLRAPKGKELIRETVDNANALKKALKLIGVEILESEGEFASDPTKICFRIPGKTGGEIFEFLKYEVKIDPETHNMESVLLSCHVGVDKRIYPILPQRLSEWIKSTKTRSTEGHNLAHTYSTPNLPTPIYRVGLDEFFTLNSEEVLIHDAVG